MPDLTDRSALVREAYELAATAHDGQERKGDGSPYIAHPLTVAGLLIAAGREEDELLAASLLHDVVEDSDHTIEEIRERFGPGVAELVAALTEDKSVEPYEERKRRHRDQVEAAGERATAIYAADKLANLRDMRALYAKVGEDAVKRFKTSLGMRVSLWHGDLEMAERVAPDLPLLGDLKDELDAFEAERAAAK